MGFLFLAHNSINKILQSGIAARQEFVKAKTDTPFEHIGEVITYDVRFGKLHMGRAIFRNIGRSEINLKPANLITFETRVSGFYDFETIYSDPATFLPLKIERRIRNLGIQEKITENYDQQNFILTITKVKGKHKEEFTIKKNSIINNAVLLPFYVRRISKPDIGWTMMAQLPTQQFLIKLVSIEQIRVAKGEFKCYHFESFPKKFEIWVSADNRRIPVKIKGLGALGYTMVMQDYTF